MHKKIYFDNAASTPLDKDVVKMLHKITKEQGNPQGVNSEALWSYNKLRWARFQVAEALGCKEEEIFFCSGATEANEFAKKIWKMESDKRVHDSLQVHSSNPDIWASSYINNETGTRDERNLMYDKVFLDLTATVGHVYIDLSRVPSVVGASFSGHKFGALQGVGVLYIKKSEQEKIKKKQLPKSPWSLRGGTPNTLGIYSLGIAIKNACDVKKMTKTNNEIDKMTKYIANETRRLGLQVNKSSHILNITFKHLGAITAVSIFSSYGIDISSGSACHSDITKPSTILLENGYSEDDALKTIRVSLGRYNTIHECKRFVKTLSLIIDKYDNL